MKDEDVITGSWDQGSRRGILVGLMLPVSKPEDQSEKNSQSLETGSTVTVKGGGLVGRGVSVGGGTGVFVGNGTAVRVGKGVLVGGGGIVLVRVGVFVGSGVAVLVGSGVFVGRGVFVLVGIRVAVFVGRGVLVGTRVAVADGRGVLVGARVGVSSGRLSLGVWVGLLTRMGGWSMKAWTSSMAVPAFSKVILIYLATRGSNWTDTVSAPEMVPAKPSCWEL